MPKLSSFSGLSSRGFGEFGTTLTLTTVTFTSSTSWTAPIGVTNLTTVSGRGSNGEADYWFNTYVTYFQVTSASYPTNPAYLDWSVPYGYAVTAQNNINASGSGERYVTPDDERFWVVNSTNSNWATAGVIIPPTSYVRGSATIIPYSSLSGYYTSLPTSGNIDGPTFFSTYGAAAIFWVYIDKLIGGVAGTASTGFGQTFPGGAANGGTAPITVFNNVSVSPGTSYSIVIPTDRPDPYITIQYLAPT